MTSDHKPFDFEDFYGSGSRRTWASSPLIKRGRGVYEMGRRLRQGRDEEATPKTAAEGFVRDVLLARSFEKLGRHLGGPSFIVELDAKLVTIAGYFSDTRATSFTGALSKAGGEIANYIGYLQKRVGKNGKVLFPGKKAIQRVLATDHTNLKNFAAKETAFMLKHFGEELISGTSGDEHTAILADYTAFANYIHYLDHNFRVSPIVGAVLNRDQVNTLVSRLSEKAQKEVDLLAAGLFNKEVHRGTALAQMDTDERSRGLFMLLQRLGIRKERKIPLPTIDAYELAQAEAAKSFGFDVFLAQHAAETFKQFARPKGRLHRSPVEELRKTLDGKSLKKMVHLSIPELVALTRAVADMDLSESFSKRTRLVEIIKQKLGAVAQAYGIKAAGVVYDELPKTLTDLLHKSGIKERFIENLQKRNKSLHEDPRNEFLSFTKREEKQGKLGVQRLKRAQKIAASLFQTGGIEAVMQFAEMLVNRGIMTEKSVFGLLLPGSEEDRTKKITSRIKGLAVLDAGSCIAEMEAVRANKHLRKILDNDEMKDAVAESATKIRMKIARALKEFGSPLAARFLNALEGSGLRHYTNPTDSMYLHYGIAHADATSVRGNLSSAARKRYEKTRSLDARVIGPRRTF